MKKIMTVCGPVDPDELGVASMHDHVLASLGPFFKQTLDENTAQQCPINLDAPVQMGNLFYLNQQGYRSYCEDNWDLSDVDLMETEVRFFKQRGGNAILEPSAPGLRTNVQGVKRISESTGVHIVASTGLYVGISWPDRFKTMTEAEFEAYLRLEIETGIDGTNIQAGHIKTAIRQGTGEEMKFLGASSRVSNETNVLITAHTSCATKPERRRKMLKTFLDAGMNPEKLLLCHLQFTFLRTGLTAVLLNPTEYSLRLDWAKEVMDSGVNICIDLFGLSFHGEDAIRLAGLISLLRAGYAEQIVIGNDVYQKVMTRSFGGPGYCSMLDYAIPGLIEHGIDEETIRKVTVTNPARMLQY